MAVVEVALVERAKEGDHAAFELILAHYQKPIYNYVLRVMGSVEDANDLTQETFVRAYFALPKTSDDLRIEPWLYRIATNLCRDQFRRRKVIRWQSLENAATTLQFEDKSEYKPEKEAMRNEQAAMVQRVLGALSEDHRQCLVLKEYHEMSCDEIGAIMGKSRAAVKSMLFRAREQFRQAFQKENPGREL